MVWGALEVPTLVAGNAMFADIVTASCPVPVNVTICGLPGLVSVIVSVPEIDPVTTGRNPTVTVQLCPGVRVTPVQVSVFEKSPLAGTGFTVTLTKPGLFTVTF